ncbi:hypothetical protein OEW28_00750 [Defluviimonas sp. WL0002]|uniref:Argininosuccinate lyase n=1 Tax=Albidovulum marisflavi TaxID=2984159 RepID=A0ABT2Z7U6_9RHOB|nr:hypothetical protein [Defluviimonas sp. WL0002]MCV2867153.1 hypothetical protein [Defluviimonas sp. WL0002]
MKIVFALAALAALASCGADGPPRAPASTFDPDLTVSGQVQIGI